MHRVASDHHERGARGVTGALARLVRAYYWATPAFALLDLLGGVNIRVPFLDSLPGLRAAYYAVGVACALLMTWRPRWTSAIALGESAVDMIFLVVGTMGAYYSLLEGPATSMDALGTNPFTPEAAVNLVLSASVMIAGYLLRQAEVAAAMRARR